MYMTVCMYHFGYLYILAIIMSKRLMDAIAFNRRYSVHFALVLVFSP